MPALINYGGESDACPGGLFCSSFMDSGILLSPAPNMDVYYPPRKRSRVTAPYVLVPEQKSAVNKQQPPCSIDILPDECLFEIFRRLVGDKEKSISACVSKRWLFLLSSIRGSEISVQEKNSTEASPRKSLPDLNGEPMEEAEEDETVDNKGHLSRCLEDKEATDIRLASIAVGTTGRGGLGKLAIRGSNKNRGVTDLGLAAIARGCPSLASLSMWDVPFVSDEGLSEIANGCPLLEKLDLYQCPLITDNGLIAIAEKCPNLTSITVDSCGKIGNEGLQAIGRFCAKLQSVSVVGCGFVGDAGVASMVASASSTLTMIKLGKLNISDAALGVVGYYGKALSHLYVSDLQNVSERGFWVMGSAMGLQKLKSLAIASCRGVTDLSLQAIAKGCPSVKHFSLRKCLYVSDAGLTAFAGVASGTLENLQLEECNRITLTGILGVLMSCKEKIKTLSLTKCLGIRDITSCPTQLPLCWSLRSLAIRGCPGFTSSSLAVVGQICPKLQSVDLGGLINATDAGLLPLIESSESQLVKVDLSGCAHLTDAAICRLVKTHGATLQLLNLDGCKKVTDISLLAISSECCLLSDLDISGCAVTDYGVAALASARQFNLESLSLSGCSKVTRGSLPFLANMGRSLMGLNLQLCNLISTQGIAKLEEKLWWCDILS